MIEKGEKLSYDKAEELFQQVLQFYYSPAEAQELVDFIERTSANKAKTIVTNNNIKAEKMKCYKPVMIKNFKRMSGSFTYFKRI